jgi:hypothetical protein
MRPRSNPTLLAKFTQYALWTRIIIIHGALILDCPREAKCTAHNGILETLHATADAPTSQWLAGCLPRWHSPQFKALLRVMRASGGTCFIGREPIAERTGHDTSVERNRRRMLLDRRRKRSIPSTNVHDIVRGGITMLCPLRHVLV